MRRLCSIITMMLAIALIAPTVTAQETDFADHPLNGTWTLITDDQELPDVIIFAADGSVTDVESSGSVTLGVWEPTGETTATLTLTAFDDDEGGITIRASLEVAPDGQSFTATYTFEPFDPATGDSMGEYGPGTATGARLTAEAPGTPTGSFEDLFGQFTGTPEASPVADQSDTTIQVSLDEFMIQADQLTLTAGQEYTFVVSNAGQLPHELVIEPAGVDDAPLTQDGQESEVEDIAPGSNPELTWTFDEPGMYQFACHVPGHYENGMVLEFEVAAP